MKQVGKTLVASASWARQRRIVHAARHRHRRQQASQRLCAPGRVASRPGSRGAGERRAASDGVARCECPRVMPMHGCQVNLHGQGRARPVRLDQLPWMQPTYYGASACNFQLSEIGCTGPGDAAGCLCPRRAAPGRLPGHTCALPSTCLGGGGGGPDNAVPDVT